MNAEHDYPFLIKQLSDDDGGGYLIEFPDLPGCMSDGETIQEAIENGNDAVSCWLANAKEHGDPIPVAGSFQNYSGKWIQRVPKSLHQELSMMAKKENVSLNAYVIHLLSLGLGKHKT